MIGRITHSAVLSLLVLFAAGPSLAAESNAQPARPKVKLVDINTAGKAQLKTLPGIGDAEAGRIVAGRPYLSKADLVTANVIPRDTYEGLKSRVVAKQNSATQAKLRALQKQEKQPAR